MVDIFIIFVWDTYHLSLNTFFFHDPKKQLNVSTTDKPTLSNNNNNYNNSNNCVTILTRKCFVINKYVNPGNMWFFLQCSLTTQTHTREIKIEENIKTKKVKKGKIIRKTGCCIQERD